MLKRYVSSILFILFFAYGCTPAKVEGEIIPTVSEEETDVSQQDTIAQEIMYELGCEDEMTRVRTRMMNGILMDGDSEIIKAGVLYLSNDEYCADAVGVFDTDHLEECVSNLQSYLKDIKQNVEYYSPDEAFKVSNAVCVDDGEGRIIMIIHKDIASASRIAQAQLKKSQ